MENLNILDEVYFYDDFYKVVGFGIITSTVSKNKETKISYIIKEIVKIKTYTDKGVEKIREGEEIWENVDVISKTLENLEIKMDEFFDKKRKEAKEQLDHFKRQQKQENYGAI